MGNSKVEGQGEKIEGKRGTRGAGILLVFAPLLGRSTETNYNSYVSKRVKSQGQMRSELTPVGVSFHFLALSCSLSPECGFWGKTTGTKCHCHHITSHQCD